MSDAQTQKKPFEEVVLPEHEKVRAIYHQVKVLNNPNILPRTLAHLTNGDYETPEIDAGLANLQPGDRIVEMGTGAGIVSAIFAKQMQDIEILSFEANPRLIPHIRKLHEVNELTDKITVHNKLVMTDETAPEAMEFSIARNFLGSSLTALTDVEGREVVSIPTIQYSQLQKEFPHNVLVMDIEGAELEFFDKTDLAGVDLVMLEIHPNQYGNEGKRHIRSRLIQMGFQHDQATSSNLVLTFKRPERLKIRPDLSRITFRYDLDPDQSLAGGITTHERALMARTPRSEGYQIKASVFDAKNERIPQAICWITQRMQATLPRRLPGEKKVEALPGTWLFGGRFHPHFGHFLTETMGRLWALDHINEPIDGVVFFSTHNDDDHAAQENFSNLSKVMDFDETTKLCHGFTRVERLIVPQQGCGIDRLMLSSPETRSFISSRLKRDFEPLPIEKLYISRTGDFDRFGRVYVGEQRLEALLRAEGYHIFHPEAHSWEDQLRHYLSAKVILGADGSAIHLVNFTGRADLKLGVIKRRNTWTGNHLVQQANAFGIEDAHVFGHLGRLWALSGHRGATFGLMPEVMFKPLCENLKAQGFISQTANWDNLTDAELHSDLQDAANTSGMDVRRVKSDGESLTQFDVCEIEGQPQVFFGE